MFIDSDKDSSDEAAIILPQRINYTRLAIVGGSLLSVAAAIQIYHYNSWWKDYRKPFHFQEDLEYGKSVDKVGHVWGGAFSSFIFSKSFEWTGLSKENSLLFGSISGVLFELYIEFQDGFSNWGFDRVDAAADIFGGFYPYLQYHIPSLRYFDFKASYFPRKLGKEKNGNLTGQKYIIVDDYEGQTFWIGTKLGKMFFKDNKYLRPFGLALGYSVRNIHSLSEQYGIWLIGLDVDFKEIIPQNTGFLRTISEGLNYFKFPTPTIQISPRFIIFGFYL